MFVIFYVSLKIKKEDEALCHACHTSLFQTANFKMKKSSDVKKVNVDANKHRKTHEYLSIFFLRLTYRKNSRTYIEHM